MKAEQIFILVHGAWHASWCWEYFAAELRARGNKVLTPDLPGHGSVIRPANTVTFDDYVTSIVELAEQQTEKVILVGHSMAGLIISQVAERIPERISELVYIAAYIPKDQESLLSIAEASESRGLSPYLIIDQGQQEIRLKSVAELEGLFFNQCSHDDAQKAFENLQPQPLQPFTAKMCLGEKFKSIPKRAFICEKDRVLIPSDQLHMAKEVTENIIFVEADHSAYYSGISHIVEHLIGKNFNCRL